MSRSPKRTCRSALVACAVEDIHPARPDCRGVETTSTEFAPADRALGEIDFASNIVRSGVCWDHVFARFAFVDWQGGGVVQIKFRRPPSARRANQPRFQRARDTHAGPSCFGPYRGAGPGAVRPRVDDDVYVRRPIVGINFFQVGRSSKACRTALLGGVTNPISLTRSDAFKTTALFDLTVPQTVGGFYQVELSDRVASNM